MSSVLGNRNAEPTPTNDEPEEPEEPGPCDSPLDAVECSKSPSPGVSGCYPWFTEESWVTFAKYGGIGAAACLGWSMRFFLKKVFTEQLGVTGSLSTKVVHGDLLANMLGAFVAGILAQVKVHLEPWHPSVFWGLSIGFCGSCTTFSSWMAEAGVQMWVPSGPNGEQLYIEQLLRGFMLIGIGLLCLLEALSAGKRVGRFLDKQIKKQEPVNDVPLQSDGTGSTRTFQSLPSNKARPLYMVAKSLVYWPALLSMWLAAASISGHTASAASTFTSEDVNLATSEEWSLDLLAGMCFAPLGAWARYELAKFNRNQRWITFPFFTYLANMIGMAMSITCWALAMAFEPEEEKHHLLRSRTWIVAISGGLCGCLSTASTFASELATLADESKGGRFWHSFRYGGTSILSAQVMACAVVVPYFHLALDKS